MSLNVAQNALVGRRLAAGVVLRLQAVDRDNKLQVRQRGPGCGERAERAGHNLDVSPGNELRQQDLKFTVSDEQVASDDWEVERVVLGDYVEGAPDQFLAFE